MWCQNQTPPAQRRSRTPLRHPTHNLPQPRRQGEGRGVPLHPSLSPPPPLQNQKDPMALDKIMKDLDQCRDGKVGFQSFFSLVAGLTIACNDYFVVHMKQKGKK
nr:protein S100-A10-like [Dromaius novaehollandiae]